jgi:hypothetical protein
VQKSSSTKKKPFDLAVGARGTKVLGILSGAEFFKMSTGFIKQKKKFKKTTCIEGTIR